MYQIHGLCTFMHKFARKSDKRTSSSSNPVIPLKIVFGIRNVISKRQPNLFETFTDYYYNNKEAHHRNKIYLYVYDVQRSYMYFFRIKLLWFPYVRIYWIVMNQHFTVLNTGFSNPMTLSYLPSPVSHSRLAIRVSKFDCKI